MRCLLEGKPPVLALFDRNPFPDAPPRYLRALLYQYRFADPGSTDASHRAWWTRELTGLYFPRVSLEDLRTAAGE